jgi:hypothetical protein
MKTETYIEYSLVIDYETLDRNDEETRTEFGDPQTFRSLETAERVRDKKLEREIQRNDWYYEDDVKLTEDEIRACFKIEKHEYPVTERSYKHLDAIISIPFQFSVSHETSSTNFVKLYDQFIEDLNRSTFDEGRHDFYREVMENAMQQMFERFANGKARQLESKSEKEARYCRELGKNTYIQWGTEKVDGGEARMDVNRLEDCISKSYYNEFCSVLFSTNSTPIERE